MKKLIVTIFLICLFSFNISAIEASQLNLGDEFLLYSENPQEVSAILNTDTEELNESIAQHNIKLLAVNKKNTKQIQLTEVQTEFSKTVLDFSALSDSSIKALIPTITGLENINCEIIKFESNKYVMINIRNDEYYLTQYFTVIDEKLQTVSFYTDINESTDYVQSVFPMDRSQNIQLIISVVGTVIFGIVCLIILYTVIRDLITKRLQ